MDDYMDHIFENDLNSCINDCKAAYEMMQFHLALTNGFFDLFNARDKYRANCGLALHKGLIQRFMEAALIMLEPICPHWSQHIWKILGKPGFVMNAPFPSAPPADRLLSRQATYLRDVANTFRSLLTKQKESKARQIGKTPGKDNKTSMREAAAYFDQVEIFVATSYPEWQATTLRKLAEIHAERGSLPESRELSNILKDHYDDEMLTSVVQYSVTVAKDVAQRGTAAFELSVPFDEIAYLRQHLSFLTRDTLVKKVTVVQQPEEMAKTKDAAVPGKPKCLFSTSSG